MPLYEYACKACQCGKVEMRTVAEREDAPQCDRCKRPMEFQLSAVTGFVKNPAVPQGRRR